LSEFASENWFKIEVPKIRELVGHQHRMPTPRQQRMGLRLCELHEGGGKEALEAARWCAQGWTRELDQEPPLGSYQRVDWDNYNLWLWVSPGARDLWNFTVIGGAGFQRHTSTRTDPYWELQFLWIHPYQRHRGVWAESFPLFLRRYHRLQIAPLTSGMQRFLAGRPTQPAETMTGTIVHLYSPTPGCPKGHGPMVENMPDFWRCGVKLPDGGGCRETYVAPAHARHP
jgi:hypothetical protein